jgi:hypothetical protein
MFFYYLTYLLVLAGASLSFENRAGWRHLLQKVYFPLALTALLLLASLRAGGVDRDYANYSAWYDRIASGDLTLANWAKDPAYVLISYIAASVGAPFNFVLFVFSGIALLLTIVFAWKVRPNRWFLLLFYIIFCRFFFPYEMTQIRAAAAIPMMSLSIMWAHERKTWAAVALFACALTFHLSVIIALPIFLLIVFGVKFESRAWIISLIPLGIVGFYMLQRLLEVLADFGRAAVYLNGSYDVKSVRLLSVYFLVCTLALFYAIIFLWHKLSSADRLIVFSSAIGLFYQAVLSSNDALALRMSEVLGLFQVAVLIIPLSHLKRNFLVAYIVFLILLGAVFFVSGLNYMQPYRSVIS